MTKLPWLFPLLALVVVQVDALAAQAPSEPFLLPKDGGQINVRDYGAKGDGVADDTEAFRKALKDEDSATRCVYVPKGTYLLSDTVGWRCRRTVVGESRESVVLKLKDGTASFGDATKPKPMIQSAMPGLYGNDSRANAAFDNYLINLTLDTGKRNPGAIALRHTTHNSGVVENLLIRSGDGAGVIGLDLSDTEFGPGMISQVEVIGFDLGIKTPGNVSNTVLQHIVLSKQKVAGMENNHPVSIHDLRSDNAVPAIRNTDSWMAQLVLVDAELTGGAKDSTAIINLGQVNLRNVKVAGYATALNDHGSVVAGPRIEHYYHDAVQSLFPSKPHHLDLPIEAPPAIPVEPLDRWLVIGPKGTEDMTAALQTAFDSGAQTIYLKPGNYPLSDTLVVRGKLRRLVTLIGGAGAGLGGNIDKVGRDKPFMRIEGTATQPPLVIEGLAFGAWPHQPTVIELAGPRTVYMKYCRCPHPGGYLRSLPAAAGGKLFMDEMAAMLDLAPGLSAWIRQSNPENNPYSPGKAHPSYIINRGSKVWVLGLKTESPAIHVITLDGGQTEILGGFFRDHVGFEVTAKSTISYQGLPVLPEAVMGLLQKGVPAFITIDSQLSASYVQYAWQPGAARDLQAIEVRGGEVKELRLDPVNQTIGLYSTAPRGAQDVVVESFTASSAVLRSGESCVLKWNVRNAKTVSLLPGIGEVAASGERTITLTAPTTWTIRAEGLGGPEEATVAVAMYRAPDNVTGAKPGLSAAYYEGQWPTLPDVTKLKPAAPNRIVAQPDLTPAKRAENYVLTFTGYVEAPTAGVWTFSTMSDDGSALWIGDQQVVDNDGVHADRERSGHCALAAGRHAVRIGYVQGAGGATLSVAWEGPGIPKQVIPASAWSHRD